MTSLCKQQHPAFVLLGYFWHSEMSFLLENGEEEEKKNWRAVRERSENSEMKGLQNVHSIISAC